MRFVWCGWCLAYKLAEDKKESVHIKTVWVSSFCDQRTRFKNKQINKQLMSYICLTWCYRNKVKICCSIGGMLISASSNYRSTNTHVTMFAFVPLLWEHCSTHKHCRQMINAYSYGVRLNKRERAICLILKDKRHGPVRSVTDNGQMQDFLYDKTGERDYSTKRCQLWIFKRCNYTTCVWNCNILALLTT
jgi:hypothetical protein